MNKAIWLAQLLHRKGAMSRKEILNAWSEEDGRGKPMGQTTFYDNRHALELHYGIRIVHKQGKYHLELPFNENNTLVTKIIEQQSQPLTKQKDCLVDTWMDTITEGVQGRRQIHVCYASPGKSAYETILSVYDVRRIKGLCYMVAYSSHHKSIRTFAVDRIQWLHLLPLRYKIPKDFCAENYFRHSYGAYGGTAITPQRIVLKTSHKMADYFRGRPLHYTQHEITKDDPSYVFFELQLSPTEDFIGQLMAFAPDVMVVVPTTLQQQMAERFRKCWELYRECESGG